MFDCPEPNVSRYFRWKRYVDTPVALLLLIFALPIVVVAWLLVRVTSPGPGFFKQIRLGLDGKPFTIYKIRTMRIGAEAATGAIWATRQDKRVNPVGKILRKTHIDELPQLFNVLRGDMALVGPHPERPEFVAELEHRIDGYAYRLYVKPGLTGLAELNYGSDTDLNDVRRKLVLDFEYIETSSFWFDLRVLLCSIFKAAFLSPSVLLAFFRLYRKAEESRWIASLPLVSRISPGDEERLSKILTKQVTV